jgi:hypothetical protein
VIFLVRPGRSSAALRYPASLTVRPLLLHCAVPGSFAGRPHFHVLALATVLLAL